MSADLDRPPIGTGQAAGLARDLYGLTGDAAELPGERDRNFRLRTPAGDYVLKVAARDERRDVLECQDRALRMLADEVPGASWPRPIPTLDGETITAVDGEGGPFLVRLLSWVDGKPLVDASPHDDGLLRSLGRLVGALDRALSGFDHSALERKLKWHPTGADAVVERNLELVEDDGDRSLVTSCLEGYRERVAARLADLPRSAIHNDANDYNVLVGPDAAGGALRAIALIDFGDMVCAHTVADLAIACAYAMLDKSRPLRVAARLVEGYHAERPLSEAELAALFELIRMRLCLSVTISAEQRRLAPDNAYLTVSERPAWALLRALDSEHPRFAEAQFRQACGFEPAGRNVAVVGWMRRAAGTAAPVVDADLTRDPLTVLDLGIGSPLLASLGDDVDVETLSTALFGRIAREGGKVGIGRYDEARGLYTTDLFRTGSGSDSEWRTVHLGIDLFLDAGSPVYAPIAGTVHSFADNGMGLDYGPTILLAHTTGEGAPFFTLYGHLSRESLDGLAVGKPVQAGERIARLGGASENGGWPPHLHFQVMVDDLGRSGEFPGVASAEERAVWLSLCPDPAPLLGLPRSALPEPELEPEAILRLRERHLGPSLSVSYREPLKVVRGRGAYLYEHTGRRYLDCVNNVAHVGHAHPRVVAAARAQDTVLNTNTRYLHDNLVEYAERLQATLPDPLSVVFLVCTGSEANDLALRLARAHTGRRDVVAVEGGYHGNLGGLIEISSYKFDGPGGSGAAEHVHVAPAPDPYRGAFSGADAGTRYAAGVRDALRAADTRGGAAAFICESVLSCGGQVVPPKGYLREAYEYSRQAGAVCIADEVQVGFGRVGTHFWGFEAQHARPDIVTLGKPIGNGHPLAAVVTTPEIAQSFANGMEYFNTYGGNPVSCAVGLAVLDVIRDEGLQRNALEVGGHLLARLRELTERHEIVGDARGMGLFLGIELVDDRETRVPAARQASYVVNRMRRLGILLSTDGPLHNVIKIKPPMVFSVADADLLVDTLDTVLGEDLAQRGQVRPRAE